MLGHGTETVALYTGDALGGEPFFVKRICQNLAPAWQSAFASAIRICVQRESRAICGTSRIRDGISTGASVGEG